MSTVRIYRSTDPGAPPHPSSVRGSMAALLRACLVTGYGSGDDWFYPAGWEEPYEEVNHCACFRAAEGLARRFWQVDDYTTDEDVTLLTQFDTMAAAESGVGARGSVYFGKWYDASSSQRWYVIADATTCYVVLDAQDNMIVHGFGEYLSLIEDDPCPSFISGHNDSTRLANDATNIPLHNGYTISDDSWNRGYLYRSIADDSISSFAALNIGTNNGDAISRVDRFATGEHAGVKTVLLPMVVKAFNDVDAGISLPCGIMRGLYVPLFNPGYPTEIEAGGRQFLAIGLDSGFENSGRLCIDISGSW